MDIGRASDGDACLFSGSGNRRRTCVKEIIRSRKEGRKELRLTIL
jgi:hypothetical protein